MVAYVALLRAVNVGGTGKLPMATLKAMCVELGFERVQTYIASGNVVFHSPLSEAEIRRALEARLHVYAGKSCGVLVRTDAEIADVLARNPFPAAPPNQLAVLFVDEALPQDALADVTGQGREQIHLGQREIFIWYRDGMAQSRLRIPSAKAGTARNINTVSKLAALLSR
ncbi:DUF1697 domain-containing protein [Lichenicoccus sp.]|uniref:DUF1697 domain-containing protein n=1 Tax=Lichenicoccus sp. TaxID=2781899 RepID=UPI003D09B296